MAGSGDRGLVINLVWPRSTGPYHPLTDDYRLQQLAENLAKGRLLLHQTPLIIYNIYIVYTDHQDRPKAVKAHTRDTYLCKTCGEKINSKRSLYFHHQKKHGIIFSCKL